MAGARGPAKMPAELEKLHGNPGKREIKSQLQYEQYDKVPTPPSWLDSVAKKEWRRLSPIIFNAKIFTKADTAAFEAYCHSYSMWVKADKAFRAYQNSEKDPPAFILVEDGKSKENILISIMERSKKEMLLFAKEFGLTPSSRSSITAPSQTEDRDDSIMSFIKNKGIKQVK